jgi:hypothetical protein
MSTMTSVSSAERTHDKSTKVFMMFLHQLEEPDEDIVPVL